MTEIEKRKERHLRLSLEEDVESDIGTGFADVRLIHRSLPEIDLEEVSTETELFGRKLSAPLLVSAITGGTRFAKEINETLAEVVDAANVGVYRAVDHGNASAVATLDDGHQVLLRLEGDRRAKLRWVQCDGRQAPAVVGGVLGDDLTRR